MKLGILALLVCLISAIEMNTANRNHPIVGAFRDDVNTVSNVLNYLFDNIGVNATDTQACFDNIELVMWYYYYAYDGFVLTDHPWNASVSSARLIGTLSPVLRNCYSFA